MNLRECVKKYNLFAIVFLTGAAVLVVEVTAVRILSIYFGNTIYTVSGVVGVILAALSAGYARGGRQADKTPTRRAFFDIIQKAGWALIVLFLLMNSALPIVGDYLPLSWGPIAAALVLFFAPSYFLGMLSPFAVKLGQLENPAIGIGSLSGKIFFWSTCGSIFGTILTAFVLIPSFGLNAIIFGTTAGILLLGGIGRALKTDPKKRAMGLLFLGLAIIVLFFIFYASTRTPPGVIFGQDGTYQRLTITDGTYAGRPARFFNQDRSQDDMIFLDGNDLAEAYTHYYALYKVFAPKLKHALFVGGGMYSMPAALHRDLPDAKIDVAEIEPSLSALAQKYFNLKPDANIVDHTEDGRHFLQKSSAQYDMTFSDVYYSLYSIPPAYTTREYFSEAKSKLSPNGIFIANLIGGLAPDNSSFLLSEIRTIKEVFPETYVFAVDSIDTPNTQNIIVLGVNGATSPKPFVFPSSAPTPLPVHLLSHLVPLDRYDLDRVPILTDDFSPVEYMTAKTLNISDLTFTNLPDGSLWNGDTAMNDIATQLSFGRRSLGAPGHQKEIDFIKKELSKTSATVTTQQGEYQGLGGKKYFVTNIIARFDPANPRRIVVGTHYDSIVRAYADRERPDDPMPGANNSASGVALLLETARALDSIERPTAGVDLVFFDGEEGANSLGVDDPKWYPLGSPYFAEHLADLYPQKPEQGVVFDMVCDKNLDIRPVAASVSANTQARAFWNIGQTIAPTSFLTKPTPQLIFDDQTALANAGIPSFLVIDYDYNPWFNTTQDTIDKCSPASLESVGRTLLQYLYLK
jgi:glutaminyl-peptide cyclotransferase